LYALSIKEDLLVTSICFPAPCCVNLSA